MIPDRSVCVAAVAGRDARFDGTFFTAVTSTGIYCRPSCPARTPADRNMTFHATAASAQAAGFRACKRCRPDAVPGSPEWDTRADLTARTMRLIGDGVVDREGVEGLAAQLGYSVRQVQRLTTDELGASPLALARAQRAQTARILLQTTDLALADVAFAAGFGSIRSFNDTIRSVFAMTPGALRDVTPKMAPPKPRGEAMQRLDLRLAFRQPFDPSNVFGHLAATAIPGVEEWRDGAYRRTLRLPHGVGIVALSPRVDHIAATLHLADLRDLTPAIARCRRLLDLDADPVAVDAALAQDPALSSCVRAAPGRRIPRTVDGAEFAIRAVLGQQVSTAAARTHGERLVRAHGRPISDPAGGLTHLFPEPAGLRNPAPDSFAGPTSRLAALARLARVLDSGEVDLSPGADWQGTRAALAAVKGIGPWTIEMIAMRSLGDPDAFPASDLGVRHAADRLGITDLAGASQRWRPWRAYATQHLWAALDHPINHLPQEDS